MNKLNIYLASGWFTPTTLDILEKLESQLDSIEEVNLYSPRRDGIMLPPNQKHDTALREGIFRDNISHILQADMVLANVESTDSYNDPGTMYEIGFAMANNVPVVGYSNSMENISVRFKGILSGFDCIVNTPESVREVISQYILMNSHITPEEPKKDKVLLVGSGDESVDNGIASHILDSGANLRWVNEMHDEVYARIDEIFEDVKYMIAVIDDRKTLVSWMIGQAYARNIPVITYSNFNYGINVMLLVSVLTHLRGTDELVRFLQQVKRGGLESIPKFDISELDSM